jgi:hypothetical protein
VAALYFRGFDFGCLDPRLPFGKTRRGQASAKFLLAALVTFVGAFVIWTLDINRIFCRPESWHMGACALAFALWRRGGVVVLALSFGTILGACLNFKKMLDYLAVCSHG